MLYCGTRQRSSVMEIPLVTQATGPRVRNHLHLPLRIWTYPIGLSITRLLERKAPFSLPNTDAVFCCGQLQSHYRTVRRCCACSEPALNSMRHLFGPCYLNLEIGHCLQCMTVFPVHSLTPVSWPLLPLAFNLPGENYGYHVGGKGGIGIDIAREFTTAMQSAGMPHSFYYSLKDSYYLNANGDNVLPAKDLLPGQVNVTQDEFEAISVAAVTELWSKYGDLAEIWFDGGISERIKGKIVPLLNKLQPNAICMGAGIENSPNEVDWVGTESGMPKYPVWSTGCNAPGEGSTGVSPASATNFCPKCGDCTLQSPDHWFFMPGSDSHALWQLWHTCAGNFLAHEIESCIQVQLSSLLYCNLHHSFVSPAFSTSYAFLLLWIALHLLFSILPHHHHSALWPLCIPPTPHLGLNLQKANSL